MITIDGPTTLVRQDAILGGMSIGHLCGTYLLEYCACVRYKQVFSQSRYESYKRKLISIKAVMEAILSNLL